MERDPAWSPDGKSSRIFSDESGEYELHIAPQDGKGEPRRSPWASRTIYLSPRWSPDSKKIAYTDKHLKLWYVDLDTGKPIRVDKDRYYGLPRPGARRGRRTRSGWPTPAARQLPGRGASCTRWTTARRTQVTDGMSDAGDPVFDQQRQVPVLHRHDGLGLVAAAGHPGMTRNADRQHLPDRARQGRPVAAVAARATRRRRTTRPAHGEAGRRRRAPSRPRCGRRSRSRAPTVTIDFDNIVQRVLALPLPPRNYMALQAGKAGDAAGA